MTVAKNLLTGPLPEDLGAKCAVTVARSYLTTWDEGRARSMRDSLYGLIDTWKEDKEIRGLDWDHLDEVNFLCAIYYDDRPTSLWKEISFAEAISLIALNEAPKRPHVATKGGSVLALYERNLSTEILDDYGPSLLSWIQGKRPAGKRSGEVRRAKKEQDLNRAAWALVLLREKNPVKNNRLKDIVAQAGLKETRTRQFRLKEIGLRAETFINELGVDRRTDIAAIAKRKLDELRK